MFGRNKRQKEVAAQGVMSSVLSATGSAAYVRNVVLYNDRAEFFLAGPKNVDINAVTNLTGKPCSFDGAKITMWGEYR